MLSQTLTHHLDKHDLQATHGITYQQSIEAAVKKLDEFISKRHCYSPFFVVVCTI